MSKKLLIIFVAVVMGAFMSSIAMAIDYGELEYARRGPGHNAGTGLNPERKGDVLLFPYYDVRDIGGQSQDTYFAIINEDTGPTTATLVPLGGVAAKLRFREWDKSEEVFDADIWLSRADVWVAAITRNAATNQARITSNDWVIVADTLTTFTVQKTLSGGFDFFWLTDYPAISNNLMGYFEVIGEERTAEKVTAVGAIFQVTRYPLGPAGLEVYPDCLNTLMGYAYLVRPSRGVAMGYLATAIANFYRTPTTLFDAPGGLNPTLLDCEDSLDELEFEISKEDVFAGYDIDPAILGRFSLVVTFPTKHFHFEARPYYTLRTALWVYGEPFTGVHMNAGEELKVYIYDRDEHKVTPEVSWWSPRDTVTLSLPYEVNIIGLYQGVVPALYPANPLVRDNVGFSTGTPGYINGWVWLCFDMHTRAITPALLPHPLGPGAAFDTYGTNVGVYRGLPLISAAIQEAENPALTGGMYGEMFDAFYEVEWTSQLGSPPLGPHGGWAPDAWWDLLEDVSP
jgi:hypothetical protein